MNRSYRLARLAVLLLLLFSTRATAQITIYNNFGPSHDGWDYNWGLGWTVAGHDVPAQYGVEQAMAFTATGSGVLSDIWVAMWYVPLDAQPDVVTLYFASHPSAQPPRPEDVLEQWTITQFGSWSQWNPPQHLIGSGQTDIVEGESYWLWAVGGATTWCGWCLNINSALTCPHTLRREGEGWLPIANETASAFRVDVLPSASAPVVEAGPARPRLLVQPNPVRSGTEIRCANGISGPVLLQLIDSSGRVARSERLVDSSCWRLDATDLPRGVYCILAIGQGNEWYASKLVVMP